MSVTTLFLNLQIPDIQVTFYLPFFIVTLSTTVKDNKRYAVNVLLISKPKIYLSFTTATENMSPPTNDEVLIWVNLKQMQPCFKVELQLPPEENHCHLEHWHEITTCIIFLKFLLSVASVTHGNHTSSLSSTCVFVSPAGRPRSSHVCSLSPPVRGDEACTVRSLSPRRCEYVTGHYSCSPVGGICHFIRQF